MSLNPFATVSDYPAMLNKIGLFTFFGWLGGCWFVFVSVPRVKEILEGATIKVPGTDITAPLGVLLIACALAILSRVIKLHDRLSDLLGIRKRFDHYSILQPMAAAAGVALTLDQQDRLRERRDQLMVDTFYRYASSSPGKAAIEQHAITMALDQWCWYWIVLELCLVILITAVVFAAFRQWHWTALGLSICLPTIWFLNKLKEQCERYARDEIRQILQDDNRKNQVELRFRAL